ncbi:MAG: metal ABC transporter ATP-binding protein [Kiritimatiellae bacterium]|nr:metal ABC transporter ATP-binding protein [Kiritimatiellia bacterium]
MNLIDCRSLVIGYRSHSGIPCPDFTVGEGDFLAVEGPNGCGKTTLLKTVAGLMRPISGEIGVHDSLGTGGIGYLPQMKALQMDFPAKVREVVLSGCQSLRGWRPFYTPSERRMARKALERFGAEGLAERPFRDLSGGQRQRVLLARALCAPRKMLLLDEPSTGLDPAASADLHSLLSELTGEGLAVMMVTHDVAAAGKCATKVLTLGSSASFERTVRHD